MSDAPSVRTDRASACYEVGETVTFRVEGPGETGELVCIATWDGWTPIAEERLSESGGEVRVATDRPGFVRLQAVRADGTPAGEAAAAISPDAIAPSLPPPGDFDVFWRGQLESWRGARLEPEIRSGPGASGCRVQSVRLPTPAGDSIYGWLMRPTAPGPYPALVLYHGAGVYAVGPEHGQDWVWRGFMVFSINPHPIPNDQPPAFYEALREGALADYRLRGREARETLYFVPMFLRASFAVDFVASLPDWNGRHLHVEGHSHGGGQALAAAALNSSVTGVSVSCPTHCDHTGPVIARVPGWPRIVELRDGVPDPRHVEAARYIDGVNFATRIRCPALFGVCFLDPLCPPTGVMAAYNALAGPKAAHHEPHAGHDHTDVYREVAFRWAALRGCLVTDSNARGLG